ncbi:hypothetical protein BLNAU_22035 [Blattamonas nauphoetae]|uniref:Uncharacterized protein n=1 Tax=Blattamonas nauphoetae TaxID=2049346 RepID=A0ABQ9WXB2_9EUKA|nr:hypothetical protein BLNAU_22035 [Blattamonas nauphoetae]
MEIDSTELQSLFSTPTHQQALPTSDDTLPQPDQEFSISPITSSITPALCAMLLTILLRQNVSTAVLHGFASLTKLDKTRVRGPSDRSKGRNGKSKGKGKDRSTLSEEKTFDQDTFFDPVKPSHQIIVEPQDNQEIDESYLLDHDSFSDSDKRHDSVTGDSDFVLARTSSGRTRLRRAQPSVGKGTDKPIQKRKRKTSTKSKSSEQSEDEKAKPKEKKKRGRPRKNPLPQPKENADILTKWKLVPGATAPSDPSQIGLSKQKSGTVSIGFHRPGGYGTMGQYVGQMEGLVPVREMMVHGNGVWGGVNSMIGAKTAKDDELQLGKIERKQEIDLTEAQRRVALWQQIQTEELLGERGEKRRDNPNVFRGVLLMGNNYSTGLGSGMGSGARGPNWVGKGPRFPVNKERTGWQQRLAQQQGLVHPLPPSMLPPPPSIVQRQPSQPIQQPQIITASGMQALPAHTMSRLPQLPPPNFPPPAQPFTSTGLAVPSTHISSTRPNVAKKANASAAQASFHQSTSLPSPLTATLLHFRSQPLAVPVIPTPSETTSPTPPTPITPIPVHASPIPFLLENERTSYSGASNPLSIRQNYPDPLRPHPQPIRPSQPFQYGSVPSYNPQQRAGDTRPMEFEPRSTQNLQGIHFNTTHRQSAQNAGTWAAAEEGLRAAVSSNLNPSPFNLTLAWQAGLRGDDVERRMTKSNEKDVGQTDPSVGS